MGLDTVEFVMAVEQQFGNDIPDKAAEAFVKVRDVRDYIVGALAKQGQDRDPDQVFVHLREIVFGMMSLRPEEVQLDSTFIDDLGMS